MRSQKSFGRRASPQTDAASPPKAIDVAPEPVPAHVATAPVSSATTDASFSNDQSIDVDRELEEWKAARRAHKGSFREPWRSLALTSAIGFGLSSWFLPDSVANIGELVTGGLGAASLFAGIRFVQPDRKSGTRFDS